MIKSTKFTIFAVSSISAAVFIGLFLLSTWVLLTPGQRLAAVHHQVLKGWLIIALPMIPSVLGFGWLLARRANAPVVRLTRELAQRTKVPASSGAVRFDDSDREFQELLDEVNGLINQRDETQLRLNQFSARVAHELRAPITLLQLHLDYASSKLDPEFVSAMAAQIKRLTDYVDTALLVAKAERGNIRVTKEKRKVALAIQDLLRPYELRAKTQRRTIRVKIGSNQEAELDTRIVGLIFNNLISNAFSHGTGDIVIHLWKRQGYADLYVLNQIRTQPLQDAGTGIGLKTVETLARVHTGLRFRSRKQGNYFGAMLRIKANG